MVLGRSLGVVQFTRYTSFPRNMGRGLLLDGKLSGEVIEESVKSALFVLV